VRYSGKPAWFLSLTGFEERDLNFYLQTMDKSISLAALPPPESLTFSNYLESVSAVAGRRFYILSGMLLPSLSRVVVREATTQANLRLATTALAVERFRLARGRLPEGLGELAPQFLDAVPTDPFDGAPLRYRRLARGYMIYSVDADGHDDGGREPPQRKESGDKSTYDITFIVER
jgi:type II secretory pathway pseudopilin PulG